MLALICNTIQHRLIVNIANLENMLKIIMYIIYYDNMLNI